mmetsp:Transcript_122899/g.173168  ORF Transcript_122899/g.173168 Transcript_122899/m.173168 type:complete len:227 (+) Transcript_122899:110-790(+)
MKTNAENTKEVHISNAALHGTASCNSFASRFMLPTTSNVRRDHETPISDARLIKRLPSRHGCMAVSKSHKTSQAGHLHGSLGSGGGRLRLGRRLLAHLRSNLCGALLAQLFGDDLVAAAHPPPSNEAGHGAKGQQRDDDAAGNAGSIKQRDGQGHTRQSHKHHQDVNQGHQAPVGGIEAQQAGGLDGDSAHERYWKPNQDTKNVEEQMHEGDLQAVWLHDRDGGQH